MQKNRYRYRVGLGVLLWLGIFLVISVPRGQSGPLDDYTFGFWGGNREESRMGREDIIAREGYCPTAACVLRLDRVTIKPNQARRGDTLLFEHHLHHSHPGADSHAGGHYPGDLLPGEIPGENQE